MYCPECNAKRPHAHVYCFDCGAPLKDDHQEEYLWAAADFVGKFHGKSFFEESKKFAEDNPHNPLAQKLFGNALFHKGKLVEAESRYRMALDIDPNNIDLMYDLGIVLYYQARVTEALAQLKKVLTADPEYSPAHYRIGLTYYHLGEFDEAVSHLKTCVELTPDYEMAHYHLGVVLAKTGKLDEAVKQFNHELGKDLRDTACRLHLEELFSKKRQQEKSLT